MSAEKPTVGIIGYGRWGKVVKEIAETAGHPTIISEITDSTTLSPRELIRQADIVIHAELPIKAMADVTRETADEVREGQCFSDIASVKNPHVRESYEMLDEKGASICSSHPQCNEKQPLSGQKVLIMPFGRFPETATSHIENMYSKSGMVLVPIEFEQHDRLMLVSQFLPHAFNRMALMVFEKMKVDPKAFDQIASVNAMLTSLGWYRTATLPPEISETVMSVSGKDEVYTLMQDAMNEIIDVSKAPGGLTKLFKSNIDAIDPEGSLRKEKNELTRIISELMVNLNLNPMVVYTRRSNEPGLLREMLSQFEVNRINIKAIVSDVDKMTSDIIKFYLGIENEELPDKFVRGLERHGFYIAGPFVKAA